MDHLNLKMAKDQAPTHSTIVVSCYSVQEVVELNDGYLIPQIVLSYVYKIRGDKSAVYEEGLGAGRWIWNVILSLGEERNGALFLRQDGNSLYFQIRDF